MAQTPDNKKKAKAKDADPTDAELAEKFFGKKLKKELDLVIETVDKKGVPDFMIETVDKKGVPDFPQFPRKQRVHSTLLVGLSQVHNHHY